MTCPPSRSLALELTALGEGALHHRGDVGTLHSKLAASSVLPVPRYMATCGYGHSGRVRTTFPFETRDAVMLFGATPLTTHASSAVRGSNVSGPGPPRQCSTPGAMNSRTNWSARSLPIRSTTLV